MFFANGAIIGEEKKSKIFRSRNILIKNLSNQIIKYYHFRNFKEAF